MRLIQFFWNVHMENGTLKVKLISSSNFILSLLIKWLEMKMLFLKLPFYIILKFIIFCIYFGTNKCLVYTTIPNVFKVKQYAHSYHRKLEMFSTRWGKNKTKQNTVDYSGTTVTDASSSPFDHFLIYFYLVSAPMCLATALRKITSDLDKYIRHFSAWIFTETLFST